MRNLRIYIARFFAFVVAIQVLNLSIDAQAFQSLESNHSIHYFNEINSFVEYFAVLVSGDKNALPEYKKSTHEKLQVHKHITIKHITLDQKNAHEDDDLIAAKFRAPEPENYAYFFYKEINPPPPKA